MDFQHKMDGKFSKFTANPKYDDTGDPKTTDLDLCIEQDERIVKKEELLIERNRLTEKTQVKCAMSSSPFNDHEDSKDDIITVKYLPLSVSTAKDVKQKEEGEKGEEDDVDEDDESRFNKIFRVSLTYNKMEADCALFNKPLGHGLSSCHAFQLKFNLEICS